MANLLQTGAAWLGDQLKAHAGGAVSIEQGTTTLTGITATLAMHEHEVIDEGGFLMRVLSHDWTFTAADLGSLQLRTGAVVTNAAGEKFEALPMGNRPCVERLDGSGILLTLHTKKVA